ncbi:hypothetical protein BCR36DRAFT_447054, partial [Piromyces finnis]
VNEVAQEVKDTLLEHKKNIFLNVNFLFINGVDGINYISLPRNIETYYEFQMQSCRNPEIQLLSLAKSYNRAINNN